MVVITYIHRQDEILQALGVEGKKTNFCHTHELFLMKYGDGKTVSCSSCNQKIINPIPAYSCLECGFYVHVCCEEMPKAVEHPFHRQHLLQTTPLSKDESRNCKACTESIQGVSLSCLSCRFDIHVSCIKPSPRALKNKCHDHHNLFYFKDKSLSLLRCTLCNEPCEDSFYRCVDCDKNFHLECIPLPRIVKNDKCHEHPVILLSSLQLVHDGEQYCCDICYKQGNAGHHVYYCDECKFIAHVECLLLEDDTSSEIEKIDDSGNKSDPEIINFQRALKHECHEHDLFYFVENGGNFTCKRCCKKCNSGFYRCPGCDISFHVDCIPLPRVIVLMEHTPYRLNFFLLDLVMEDHSDDHQCVFCKKSTNPEDHVYYCQESNFFAHIECLDADGNLVSVKNLSSLDPEQVKKVDADSSTEPNMISY